MGVGLIDTVFGYLIKLLNAIRRVLGGMESARADFNFQELP